MTPRRVVIVGGGITGITVAERLGTLTANDSAGRPVSIELYEASDQLGGKLRSSPFAGRPSVDEGADAFLTRVPHALGLASRVGLADDLVAPATSSAFVWHERLHPIPDGLMLGLPGNVRSLASSRLLSVRGKARAAIEPLLPRRDDGDSIGQLVRGRFGNEVHERLVDALVGSIYGADTDRFSLAMVPQLATLAAAHRSLLLGARSARATAPPRLGPVFSTPVSGMGMLALRAADRASSLGVAIGTAHAATTVSADGVRWRIDDGAPVDAIVLAGPAAASASLVAAPEPELSRHLRCMTYADVAIVTVVVDALPERLLGHSGYLVPKPDQGLVTAVSFGSQKWAHWGGEGEILRISLGRDGLPIADRRDDQLMATALDEVGRHLGRELHPTAVRVTRWPSAFPQYRPGHLRWLEDLDRATPPGLFLTGASYRGIGVPACIADAERVANDVISYLGP